MNKSAFPDKLNALMNEIGELYTPKAKTPLLEEKRNKKLKTGKLSYQDMGDIAGVTSQAVFKWGNPNSPTTPKMEYIQRLSDAYDVSVPWLLGLSDVPNDENERDFSPFKELGFSYKAYENLCQLKKQGEDMKSLMQGLNYILEYGTHPWSWLGEEIEELEKQIELEDDSAEKEDLNRLLQENINQMKTLNIPILEQLNKFFDLYPQGTYVEVPVQVLLELRNSLEKNGVEGTRWSGLFKNTVSPAMTDSAALLTIENTLKERKKHLLKEVLKGRDIDKEVDSLFDRSFDEIDESETGPIATQEYALMLLNNYYNPKTEK